MHKENRKAVRRKSQLDASIYSCEGKPLSLCQVQDISATGVKLLLPRETELPRTFVLYLSRGGQVRRLCKVIWQFSVLVGAQFDLELMTDV